MPPALSEAEGVFGNLTRSSAETKWASLPGSKEVAGGRGAGRHRPVKVNSEELQHHRNLRSTFELFFLGCNPFIHHQTLVKCISYKGVFQLCVGNKESPGSSFGKRLPGVSCRDERQ